MGQYIDKSVLVTELEKRQKEEVSYDEDGSFVSWADQNHYSTLESIKDFINTLEVKEVDLDREIRRYRMRNPIIQHREESLYDYMTNVAKHFFELDMSASNKAQKGE